MTQAAGQGGPHNLHARPRLRLSRDEGFDHRRYGWAFRDSGLLARLGPAETKVFLQAYMMADAGGECDLPATWLADQLGYTTRAVRDAIGTLRRRGVFADAGPGLKDPRVRRIRLALPMREPPVCHTDDRADSPGDRVTPASAAPGTPAHGAPAPGTPGSTGSTLLKHPGWVNVGSAKGERTFRDGGTYVPRWGNHASPKGIKKANKKVSSKGAPVLPLGDERSLWEPAPYERAAAAALVCWLGMPPRMAHGLITQHRPTHRQVRIVLANAFAWRRAHRLGQAPPLRSLVGFVRQALRSGTWMRDDRIGELRALRAKTRQQQRRQARQSERQAAIAQGQSDQAKQDSELWQSLTDQDRQRLRQAVIDATRPGPMRERVAAMDMDSPILRALMLRRFKQESTR